MLEPDATSVEGLFFRQVSPRHSPLWHKPLPIEPQQQEAQRYNRQGIDYVQYFASSPRAAWAEHVRHEGIKDPVDLEAVRRAIYAAWITEVEIADLSGLEIAEGLEAGLSNALVGDDEASLERARALADDLRLSGYRGLLAPSAALPGSSTLALFGPRSEHITDHPVSTDRAWVASSRVQVVPVATGSPSAVMRVLDAVRHFGDAYSGPDAETDPDRD